MFAATTLPSTGIIEASEDGEVGMSWTENKMWNAIPIVLLAYLLVVLTASARVSDLENPTCDGRWHIIPAVDAVTNANDYNSLNAVAARSATDVWAVGNFHSFSDAADKTLTEHWNGTKWMLVDSPNSTSQTNILAGVAVVAPNNAWAVGYEVINDSYQTLIEHWNGKTWSFAQNGTHKGLLSSVAAIAAND